MAQNNNELIETAKKIIRSQAENYLQYPNITSVGIGYKISEGKTTTELSIQFSVAQKAKAESLESLVSSGTKEIPEEFKFGKVVIPTDVVQRSFSAHYQVMSETVVQKDQRKLRQNVIKPGISVGHVNSSAGTIGSIVYDIHNGTPYVLSNWHVLDGGYAQTGDPIVQPGPYDDSNVANNLLGKLVKSHLGVAGDCAISTIENRDFNEALYEINVEPKKIAKVDLGDKVIKSGRTTGVTHGVVSRIHVTTKIDYEGIGEQQVGGFEIVIDPKHKPVDGEISKGGDSGSLWLVKDKQDNLTNIAAGLHFAGESSEDQPEHALACYIHSVLQKLEITLVKPKISPAILSSSNEHLGYRPNFMGVTVDLPELSVGLKRKVAKVGNSLTLDYTHFSVCMNKSRRIAFYTAVNIDGDALRKIIRKKDKWVFDSRIGEEFQCGNDIYENNKLDRGHLVRRLDPCWGPDTVAKQAEVDTFHYTNAAPQHANLNQKIWGDLEDYILKNTDVNNLKINVFTGPVFNETNDVPYRGILIPIKFWKVVTMVKEDGSLSATAYILDQENEMDNLEKVGFVFGEYRTYQTTIAEVERLTGFGFGNLKNFDPKAIQPEAIVKTGRTLVDRMERIVF